MRMSRKTSDNGRCVEDTQFVYLMASWVSMTRSGIE